VAERAGRHSPDFTDLAHEAAVAAAKAKIIADELALRSATALFDVGGASAATERQNLDRHWRNARTLSTHNPASYKAQALGAWEILGTRLPGLGFF
jgi:alkylation response protein AidB-like acyl-CoA dehydrogenase